MSRRKYKRLLRKQRFLAILLLLCGTVTLAIDNDGTAFVMLGLLALPVLFTNQIVVYHD